MKRKALIIATIIFFLVVSTNYFWESKLGNIAFPVFMFLVVVYLILVAGLIGQIFYAIREKFTDRQRLFAMALLTILLTLIFFFPNGLVNFNRFERKSLFIAQREGAANCMTIFKLVENNKFVESNHCFGTTEIKGDYKMKGDTIFFSNVSLGRDVNEYYMYAVIKQTGSKNEKLPGNLVRYKSNTDSTGNELWITKNELMK